MEQIRYFAPGVQDEDGGILSRLRWPIPPGVTQTYVEAYTRPGDLVLLPYCQGVAAVRESLRAGRRVLAVNFDPAVVLVAQTALTPLPARQLDAGVARLGDSLKQGMPLRRYLEGLYATTCPACLRPAVVDYFVWDREQDAPVAKYLRCPACGWDGRTAVEPEDQARLNDVPVGGMHYHYVLDRVAPHQQQGSAPRDRLEALLGLYSPRNLYALAEITLKIQSLFLDGPLRQALDVLLLDCLERCSSLTPPPTSRARRRGLSRPARFLERNVWHAFEEAVARLQGPAARPVSGLADSLQTFQATGDQVAGFIGRGLVRDLPRTLPPRSIRLILVSPPPLDSAAWVLSYFWGAWLLGAGSVAPLRPLLRQRTPDPAWYARVMAGSLRSLGGLLRDDGRLVLVLTGQRPTVVEALVLAASRARLGIASLVQHEVDYRLELTPTFLQPVSLSPVPLKAQIQAATAEAAAEVIQGRGEPVAWRTLHAAIQLRLAQLGLVARALQAESEGLSSLDWVAEQMQAALNDPTFVSFAGTEGGKELWWLEDPADLAPSLCDRVEIAAHELLHDTLATTEATFTNALYARFPGALTPEASLVATCLREFGREVTPGYWQLRTEDLPDARQIERRAIVKDLLTLGQRLGYRAVPWAPFDAAWFEGEQAQAAFVVRWQAAVSEALALTDRLEGARPYLVIPGGRAALASYKLAHNPLWQQTMAEAGWRFIKYRHVRQLVAQPDVDKYVLRTIVGLDPIVEQESAQLSLF